MEHVRLFTSTLDVSQDGGGTVTPCIGLQSGLESYPYLVTTSKEPVCPRVELILKIIIILLIIFLGFIKSKPC